MAVVGTSGSGKSTLLNMIGGLDLPTYGSVEVRGNKLVNMSDEELTIFRRRNIGFIFQNYNLVPMINAYENIVLPVELDGGIVDKHFGLKEIVRLLGIEDKLDVCLIIFQVKTATTGGDCPGIDYKTSYCVS